MKLKLKKVTLVLNPRLVCIHAIDETGPGAKSKPLLCKQVRGNFMFMVMWPTWRPLYKYKDEF